MLNDKMCTLIDIYMKYSSKSCLSVDEFMMFRKQVVEEELQGIKDGGCVNYNNYNNTPRNSINNSSIDIDQQIKQEVLSKFENRNVTSTPKYLKEGIENESNRNKKNQQVQFNHSIQNDNNESNDDKIEDNTNDIGKGNTSQSISENNNFSDQDFLTMMQSVID